MAVSDFFMLWSLIQMLNHFPFHFFMPFYWLHSILRWPSHILSLFVALWWSTMWIPLCLYLPHVLISFQTFVSSLSSILSLFLYIAWYFFFFFLAISHSMWRLSFPTREGTCVPWLGQCGVLTTGQPGKSQLGIFEPECLNMFEMLKECFLQIEYFINVKEGQNTHLWKNKDGKMRQLGRCLRYAHFLPKWPRSAGCSFLSHLPCVSHGQTCIETIQNSGNTHIIL